jgi:antitoxin component YwqK of YwqJK toxin-antitoxin module
MAKTNAVPEENKLLFSDGTIKEKKFLQDGKLEGEYTSYYNNGQIMAHLFFFHGKKKWRGGGLL